MATPDLPVIKAYLGDDTSWDDETIEAALRAEAAAQSRACRVPSASEEWPADLVEALCRRVQHNLALRRLPLGLQASISESGVAQMRVGGNDAEVRRLEAPHRRLVLG